LVQVLGEASTAPTIQRSRLAAVASYIETVGWGMPLGTVPVVPV
jgi:hypothetical protein